ncbi:chaperone protein ClpB1 [Tanacetum coccineum]
MHGNAGEMPYHVSETSRKRETPGNVLYHLSSSMLNPDNFTHLTCHILFVAHEIAKAAGHEELTLLHVVAASISDWNSLFKQAITNVDDEETSNRAEYVLNEALRKLPSQSTTSLDCVPISIHWTKYILVTKSWGNIERLRHTVVTLWNKHDVRIAALDIWALTAGTKFTGEFLGRLGNVLEEVAKSDGKVILFIDELHVFLREGRLEEKIKRCGKSFEPRCIGATTLEEHRKYIENDASLGRHFQQVLVAEPSVTDAINILRGLQKKYEDHHKVLIHDNALVAAVQLSNKYISGRFLPNKAINLLDEACAKVRVQMDSETRKINNCERLKRQFEVRLHALQNEKDEESKALISEVTTELDGLTEKLGLLRMVYKTITDRTHEIRSLKMKQEQLMVALDEALRQGDAKRALDLSYGELHEVDTAISKFDDTIDENSMQTETVGQERITEVVSHWTGIPVTRLGTSEEGYLTVSISELLLKIKQFEHTVLSNYNTIL